jgi:DNA polymerase III sliding clamp (beta) subunit (PCNA family)
MPSGEIATGQERERNLTKIIFETATLADAVKKAARVAPTRGSAFDKASGLVLTISDTITVKATDLIVFYTEWIEALEVQKSEGIVYWRVNSENFAGVLSSLNHKTAKNVTLEEKLEERGRVLHLRAGKTRAKFVLMDVEFYPQWGNFDPDELQPIPNLGAKLNLVDWACDKNPPLNGIYVNGQFACGTDKYKLIRTDLYIPEEQISNPVVIPTKTLASVLDSKLPEVNVAFGDDELLIMPDDYTQIRAMLLASEYPNVVKAMDRNHTDQVKFKKDGLIEIMNRALNFVGADRFPSITVFIGKEEIAVMMSNNEIGQLGDIMDLPGQALHDRVKYILSPSNVISSMEKAPSDEITLCYYSENPLSSLRIVGPEYEAWVLPRRGDAPGH